MKRLLLIVSLIFVMGFSTGPSIENTTVEVYDFQLRENPLPEAMITIEAEGAFVFTLDGEELLRITNTGDFFVEGRLTANDIEVYEAVKTFFFRVIDAEEITRERE